MSLKLSRVLLVFLPLVIAAGCGWPIRAYVISQAWRGLQLRNAAADAEEAA